MQLSDDKKKIIYIGLIIFCLVTTGAVVFMNMGGPSTTPESEPIAAPGGEKGGTAAPAVGTSITAQIKMINDANYPAASVFPTQRQFDISLFKSQKFLALTSQELPQPQPEEFGVNDNPFRSILKKQ